MSGFLPQRRNDVPYIYQMAIELQSGLDRIKYNVVKVTADYDSGPDSVILADATAGSVNVNLPPAKDANRSTVIVKKTDASGNTVFVTADGSETIDGSVSKDLLTQYEKLTLLSDGLVWHVI